MFTGLYSLLPFAACSHFYSKL